MEALICFLIFTLISIILEYILLTIIDNVDNPKIKSGLRKFCKVLFVLLTIFYIILFSLFCIVTFSAFQDMEIQTGIKMLLSTIILGVGIYYLLLRKMRLKLNRN